MSILKTFVISVAILTITFSCNCGNKRKFSLDKTYVHPLLEMPIGLPPNNTNGIINVSAVTILHQAYESLFYFDSLGNIEPLLVDNWRVSNDGIKYTFYLKKGVFFHDMKELVSSDVVDTLKNASNYRHDIQELVKGKELADVFSTCGKYCININLPKPYPMLLPLLTGSMFKIYPRGYLDKKEMPPGTGPFRVDLIKGGTFVLKRFLNYHGGTKSNIGNAVFKHLNKDDAIQLFKDGKVDDLFEYALTKGDSADIDAKIISIPTLTITYLGMNTKLNPFNNKIIRSAVQYAVDVDNVYNKFFQRHIKLNGIVPRGIAGGGRKNSKFPYSLNTAKKLIGKSGVQLPINIHFWVRTQDWNDLFINKIKQDLSEIGINASAEKVDNNVFYKKYFAREQQFFFITLSANYPDAGNYLNTFKTNNTDNDVLLSNKNIDLALDELFLQRNSEDRNKIIHHIEDIILAEGAVIPIYQKRALSAHQNNIEGINMSYLWHSRFIINNYIKND